MTYPTLRESLNVLEMQFTQLSGMKAVNIYMNKSHLIQLNKDLGADPERDLKKYRDCNIILWKFKNISLGLYQQ